MFFFDEIEPDMRADFFFHMGKAEIIVRRIHQTYKSICSGLITNIYGR